MGRYNKTDDIWQSGHYYKEGGHKCSFCAGDHPTAHWNAEVFCCRTCAIRVLPAFIADATINNPFYPTTYGDAENHTLTEVKAGFWKAAASIFYHARKKRSASGRPQ